MSLPGQNERQEHELAPVGGQGKLRPADGPTTGRAGELLLSTGRAAGVRYSPGSRGQSRASDTDTWSAGWGWGLEAEN